MTTDLSPASDEYINLLVHTGRFASRTDALDEAIHLLQEKEVKQRIEKGIQEIESGQGIELNSDEELREFLDDVLQRAGERVAARQTAGS